jgi:hypothetical protein
MLTRALFVAALIAGSASVATAQNTTQHHPAHSAAARTWHSAPVLQQRDVALPSAGSSVGPFWYSWSGPTTGGGL